MRGSKVATLILLDFSFVNNVRQVCYVEKEKSQPKDPPSSIERGDPSIERGLP